MADGSVVWHSYKLSFFESVITRYWFHVVVHSPVSQILLHVVVRMSIMAPPPAWTNSAGVLSTPTDFSIFSALTAASTSSHRIGWCSSSVKYYLSRIAVKVWAVKDFILLCERLPRLVWLQIYPVSLLSGPWLTGMLSWCYSFWGMLPLPGIDPVSKSLLPSSCLSWSYF